MSNRAGFIRGALLVFSPTTAEQRAKKLKVIDVCNWVLIIFHWCFSVFLMLFSPLAKIKIALI
jgi:hypothetical protein